MNKYNRGLIIGLLVLFGLIFLLIGVNNIHCQERSIPMPPDYLKGDEEVCTTTFGHIRKSLWFWDEYGKVYIDYLDEKDKVLQQEKFIAQILFANNTYQTELIHKDNEINKLRAQLLEKDKMILDLQKRK